MLIFSILDHSCSFYLQLIIITLWCFSIVVNNYFQVSFNLKIILYVAKISQNTVTEFFRTEKDMSHSYKKREEQFSTGVSQAVNQISQLYYIYHLGRKRLCKCSKLKAKYIKRNMSYVNKQDVRILNLDGNLSCLSTSSLS